MTPQDTNGIEGLDEAIRLLQNFVSDRENFGGGTIDDAIDTVCEAARRYAAQSSPAPVEPVRGDFKIHATGEIETTLTQSPGPDLGKIAEALDLSKRYIAHFKGGWSTHTRGDMSTDELLDSIDAALELIKQAGRG